MAVLKLKPIFKQYLWGGNNLREIYKKETPEPPVAESWEISAHSDGLSHIDGGKYDGKTIPQLCEQFGKLFYGKSMKAEEEFPLLFKILDAKENLSVQVHPDDEYADQHENGSRGKTEAWYILSAEENAQIIYGFNKDVTKEQFQKAIENNTIDEILNKVKCKTGDVFYIPAGTVHAVCKGLVIAEIQQSSNNTYRIYDYNRRDKDGNLRELHIEKALAVSNLKSSKGRETVSGTVVKAGENIVKKYIEGGYFNLDEITVSNEYISKTDDRLHMLFIVEGEFLVNGEKAIKGESLIVSASEGEYVIQGEGKLLRFWG